MRTFQSGCLFTRWYMKCRLAQAEPKLIDFSHAALAVEGEAGSPNIFDEKLAGLILRYTKFERYSTWYWNKETLLVIQSKLPKLVENP